MPWFSKLWEWLTYQVRRLLTGLCWVGFGLGGLILTFLWFPYLNCWEKDSQRRIELARRSISSAFRFFLHVTKRLRVVNVDIDALKALENVRGALIVANHPTILDYVMIAAAMPQLDCLVKSALRENIFLRGPVKAADYLFNDDHDELLEQCKRRLGKGDNILIFPEGTRTVPGEPLKLKRGVAHIALRLGAPIEVLYIDAPHGWLSKGWPWYAIPKRCSTIRVHYLQRIIPKDFEQNPQLGYAQSSRALTKALKTMLEKGADTTPKGDAAQPTQTRIE